ncbi:methyl-accepting chemotaxis protein [Celerinatantimonas sp. YJH-8]|uniref:methyl-accepting chemotaxis protein n=1 Tax=Celerinatantimonas sp. YJH-8 TaxID=3228714 RepID=UPI0038C6D4BE
MEVKKVLSIRAKMILLAVLLGLAMIIVVAAVWISLKQNNLNAEVINIAGRQRMLTKKFATEQLYQALGSPHQQTQQALTMAQTEPLYKLSLQALQQGGTTYLDLTMTQAIKLPKTDYAPFTDQLKNVETLWQQQLDAAAEMHKAVGTDGFEAAVDRFLQLNHQSMLAMNKAVVIYTSYSHGSLDTLLEQTEVITVIALLIELILAIWIIRSITQPMSRLIAISRRFSNGKLQPDQDINNLLNTSETGTLAQYIEKLRQTLHTTLADMQTSSYQVHLSADQVSGLSSEISTANADEQEQFRMMIDSSDELSHVSQQFDDIANNTSAIVQQCTEQSTLASEMVAQNIAMMHETTVETERASSVIQTLSSTAESVYGIVDAIRTISEQTNLLALNAAIEAARAGDQGRGFAVVADEVRTLAARTGSSTDEISKLIGELTDGVNNAVQSMQSVAEKVVSSRDKSHQTEESIDAVRQLILNVADAQQQISTQAQVQHEQLSELKHRQTELYETLDESRQKSQASAIIAEQLAEISQGINQTLEQFDLGVILRKAEKQTLDKRHYPRLKTGIHYLLQQGSIKHEGLTEDLSLGGMKILTTEKLPLQKNQPIHVKLYYAEGQTQSELSFLCDLVGDSKGEKNRHHYHLQFQTINDKEQRVLEKLFANHGMSSHFTSA